MRLSLFLSETLLSLNNIYVLHYGTLVIQMLTGFNDLSSVYITIFAGLKRTTNNKF